MKKTIAMIPARMGSQRLKKKNLRKLQGVTLIERAIDKCKAASCFDEIWVNSENIEFKAVAERNSVSFHQRPEQLGDANATSEQFVQEFLEQHECENLIQVHSIAPLLTSGEVKGFVETFKNSEFDVLLSCIEDQIEVAYKDSPVNFTFSSKTNSQDLTPVQRVTWSITGWRRQAYLNAFANNKCATYSGKIGFYPVSDISGHVIKTQADLDIAEALLGVVQK
jgi:CMP-N-acetylneuraminic acid synthetase